MHIHTQQLLSCPLSCLAKLARSRSQDWRLSNTDGMCAYVNNTPVIPDNSA